MNKVWCLLCCLIPILGFGQHRTFYNKAHEKVDSSAGYDYSETVEKLAGGWRNVKRYFPNGNLRFEGTFSTYQIKGEKDVEEKLHQFFREDSVVLWFTENYVNGKLQGESRTYYPSGEPAHEIQAGNQ